MLHIYSHSKIFSEKFLAFPLITYLALSCTKYIVTYFDLKLKKKLQPRRIVGLLYIFQSKLEIGSDHYHQRIQPD